MITQPMEPMGSNPRSTGCQGLEIHRILQAEPEVGQPRARLLAIPRGWQSGGILSGYPAFLPEPSYPRTTRQGDQGRAGRDSGRRPLDHFPGVGQGLFGDGGTPEHARYLVHPRLGPQVGDVGVGLAVPILLAHQQMMMGLGRDLG